MKRILSLLLSVLILFSALLYLPKTSKVYASSDVILQYDSNIINQVGQQAAGSVSCACFALAYCRSILDGYAHSWSEYDGIGNGDQWNAECAWGNGNYKMAWAPDHLSLYQAVYDQINNGRPTVIHVDGHNNPRSSYHWVAVVGYRGTANRNSLSAYDFYILDPGYTPIFDNLGSVGYEPKWEDHPSGSGYAYRYTDSGSVSVQGQQPSTPPQPDVEKPVVSVTATDSEHPVTISYNACANATHYDIRFYNASNSLVWAIGCCDDGASFNNLVEYSDTTYSHTFPAGSYSVKVAAVNISTGKYNFSDAVSFTVAEPPIPKTRLYFTIGKEKDDVIPCSLHAENIHGDLGGVRIMYPYQYMDAEIKGCVGASVSTNVNKKAGIMGAGFPFGVSGKFEIKFELTKLPGCKDDEYTLTAELVDYYVSKTNDRTPIEYVAENGIINTSTTNKVLSGKIGDSITWLFDSSNTLTFTGTGSIPDRNINYSFSWDNFKGAIETIVFSDGIERIGASSFSNCNNLETVIVLNSTAKIGNYAFRECKNLQTVSVQSNDIELGAKVFEGTPWLDEKLKENPYFIIGGSLISASKDIQNAVIPNNVTNIEESAFEYCKLNSVTIPESVTNISRCAFYGCSNLTKITIPESVTSIGGYAFYGTPWLDAKRKDNSLIIINGILVDGQTCVGDIIIPNNVTYIGESAFEYCDKLTSVKIPDSVSCIDRLAFHHCHSITQILIPNSTLNIGDHAFYECINLKSSTIPDSVTSIGKEAFRCCDSLIINGYSGSLAEEYAEEYNIPFAVIEKQEQTTTTLTTTIILTTSTMPKSTTTITTTTTTKPTTTTTSQTTPTTTATTKPVLKIDKNSITMTNGDQYTISANRNDVTYKSNNPDVAIVSSNGTITAVGVGQATISVIDSDSNVVQVKVEVTAVTTTTTIITTTTMPKSTTTTTQTTPTTTATTKPELKIDNTNITLTNGDQFTISANRNDITYKSNNPDVAIVSSNGTITAVGVGQATISVIDSDSNVVQVKVEVTAVTSSSTSKITETTTMTSETKPTEPEYTLGDVNEDSEISVEDAQLVLIEYVSTMSGLDGSFTEKQQLAGDVNGDKQISVEDAQTILIYYVSNTLSGQSVTWDELLGKNEPAKQLPKSHTIALMNSTYHRKTS